MTKFTEKTRFLITFGLALAIISLTRLYRLRRLPPPYFASKYHDIIKTSNNTLIPLKRIEEFFAYLNQDLLPCSTKRSFGGSLFEGHPDGQKKACLDKNLGLDLEGKCTVLSFGINNEWSFDDSIAEYGCKVFSFDPTMGLSTHERSKNVKFFNLGIGGFSGCVVLKGGKRALINRYEDTLNLINKTNSEISYLKMDVEGSEINFFDDIFRTKPELLATIKQIGMEIHPMRYEGNGENPDGRLELLWNYFQLLEYYGFQLMFMDINAVPKTHYVYKNEIHAGCYELVWAKRKLFMGADNLS